MAAAIIARLIGANHILKVMLLGSGTHIKVVSISTSFSSYIFGLLNFFPLLDFLR